MKKITTSILFVIFVISNIQSQSRNSIYAELGGQSLTFAINYDARFYKRNDGFGGRVGIGYMNVGDASMTTIPLSLNYLFGKYGKYLELGLGLTYTSIDFLEIGNGSGVLGTMSFSYRKQPSDGGFMYKVGFTPVFALPGAKNAFFIPYYGGVSLGYAF